MSLCWFGWTGLNQQTSRLWTSVSGLNHSLVHQDGILGSVQKSQDDVYSRVKSFNSSLSHVLKELRRLSEDSVPGEPEHPLRPQLLGLTWTPTQ